MEKKTKTICLDFDGVIHSYSKGWHDGTIYDSPKPGAVEGIKKLREKGYELVICTVRDDLAGIKQWLEKYGVAEMKVTNQKPKAIVYIDDRGFKFENWKNVLENF